MFFYRAILLVTLLTGAAAATGADKQNAPPLGHPDFYPSADRPVGWRGDGSGCFPAATPVTEWDWHGGKNVIWRTEMPAYSNAGPILVGDKVFTCAEPDTLLCVSAGDGKILWQKTHEDLRVLISKEETHSGCTGHTMPTPTSDGERVYFKSLTGALACYDLAGTRLWGAKLDKQTELSFRAVASPVLVDGVVCFTEYANRKVNLLGFDAVTGQRKWEVQDVACGKWSSGSPVRLRLGGRNLILCPNGKVLSPNDGKLLAGDACYSSGASPVVDGNLAYCCTDSSESFSKEHRQPIFGFQAVRTGILESGELKCERLWGGYVQDATHTNADTGHLHASPVYHDGFFYLLNQNKDLLIVDAQKGVLVKREDMQPWQGKHGEHSFPNYVSLMWAGKHLFIATNSGAVAVREPGPDGKVIQGNPGLSRKGDKRSGDKGTDDRTQAAFFFQGDRFYVRSHKFLYCIGPK